MNEDEQNDRTQRLPVTPPEEPAYGRVQDPPEPVYGAYPETSEARQDDSRTVIITILVILTIIAVALIIILVSCSGEDNGETTDIAEAPPVTEPVDEPARPEPVEPETSEESATEGFGSIFSQEFSSTFNEIFNFFSQGEPVPVRPQEESDGFDLEDLGIESPSDPGIFDMMREEAERLIGTTESLIQLGERVSDIDAKAIQDPEEFLADYEAADPEEQAEIIRNQKELNEAARDSIAVVELPSYVPESLRVEFGIELSYLMSALQYEYEALTFLEEGDVKKYRVSMDMSRELLESTPDRLKSTVEEMISSVQE